MIFKYKGGYGGNYTIKWLLKMYPVTMAIKIYLNQEIFKIKNIRMLIKKGKRI